MVRVTKLNLHRTISDIMNKGNLDSLTTKKIRLLCEAKYNTDLSERKDEIDNIVLDFVRMKSQELKAAESNQQANQVIVNSPRNTKAVKNNVTSDEESNASEEDDSGDSEEEGGCEGSNLEGNASGGSEEGSSCSGSESCSDSECSSDSSEEEDNKVPPASTSKKAAVNAASLKKAAVNTATPKIPSASSASSKESSVAGPSKAAAVITGPSKGTNVISGSSKKATANAIPAKKAATNTSVKNVVSNASPAKKASVNNTKKRMADKETESALRPKRPKKNDAAKKIELDDAALARQLQAEEWNFRRGTVNKLFRNTPQKKNDEPTKKKKPCPFLKKCLLSPALAEVLGTNEMSRPDIVQKMWSVVRERNLFDSSNKQYALCDEQLKNVFGKKRIRLIGMMKYLKHHIKDIN